MAAVAETESLGVINEHFVTLVHHNLLEGCECLGQGLAELAESSLQPHHVFGWTQHAHHKAGRGLGEWCVLGEPVSEHSVSVNPEDVPEALEVLRAFPLDEVADEEAFALGLHVEIVTLGRASNGTASAADG